MKSDVLGTIAGIIAAVLGLAILAVILAKGSATKDVITASTSGLAGIIKAATGVGG